MISRIFFGPPDWLVTKFTSRDRRALALIPNFSAETPVEEEEV